MSNYKYHSTGQFRNIVKNIQTQARFKGFNEDNKPIIDSLAVCPVINYIGTVKLHGTNASIVLEDDVTISFHSKSKMLATIIDGEFTLHSDNAEFAQSMWRRIEGVYSVIELAKNSCIKQHGKLIYPIKISGEWVGNGIQKGVAISELPTKSLFVFGVKCGEPDRDEHTGWLPLNITQDIKAESSHIYNIQKLGVYDITIDFNNPAMSTNTMTKLVEKVEECCPSYNAFNLCGSKVGEGIVWIPRDSEYCFDNGNWFKTKGEKHSVTKVKKLVTVDVAKLENIEKFVEYAATTNRFEQGLSEVGLSLKKVGEFIGWVNRDINKEEGDTLESNNLSMKDVGKDISTKARTFYLGKLNEELL